jgi:hypothetical protein
MDLIFRRRRDVSNYRALGILLEFIGVGKLRRS